MASAVGTGGAIALILGFVVCGAGAVVGCSSSNSSGPAASTDAGADADDSGDPGDAGSDALPNIDQDPNVYPAQHQPIPQMANDPGGVIITAPKIVTITYAGDTRRDSLRAFDDYVTTSDWWNTIAPGYGIGKGSGGGYVELPALTTMSLSDGDLQGTLQSGVMAGTIPAPTANTIYVFHFAKGVTISQGGGGSSCSEFGGYHYHTTVTPPGGTATTAVYAIIPNCPAYPTDDTSAEFDQVTIATSHEIAEAATDPTNGEKGGFGLIGDDSWLPSFYPLGSLIENGDACSNPYNVNAESYNGDPNYLLQRIWSNAAAKDSDNPCQPTRSGRIYFAAAVKTKPITGASGMKSYGYIQVPRGGTVNVEVNVFSKKELPHPFLIYVGKDKQQESDPSDIAPPGDNLTVALSKQQVSNGDGVWMTITAAKTSALTYERLFVRSVLEKNDFNDWPFIVQVTK